jgi:biopolymer transport protein ExbD
MARKVKVKRIDPELDLLPIMNLFSILIPFLLSVAVFQKMAVIDINMPLQSMAQPEDTPPPEDDMLNLTVTITSTGMQIASKNGFFPKIYAKEMRDYQCEGEAEFTRVDPSSIEEGQSIMCLDGVTPATNKDLQKILMVAVNKTSEEDPGTMMKTIVNANDSVYINSNMSIMAGTGYDYSIFVKDMVELQQPGKIVSTLALNSGRKVDPKLLSEAKAESLSAYDVLARILGEMHEKFAEMEDGDKVILLSDDDVVYDKVIAVMDVARESGFFQVQLAKMGAGE